MHEMISIIVPVYKVEKYIRKCIESILNQTYTYFELILIDDGSPDNCPQIIDEYALKDERIKVIHQENQGLSGARNTGLKMARGEWISFIDSDDFIHPLMIETLFKMAKQFDSDIAVCNFKRVSLEHKIEEEIKSYTVHHFNNKSALKELFTDRNIIFTVTWNKLYRKELFNDIWFPIGRIHEDEFVTYKLLYKSNKIVYIDVPYYYYVQRDNSIMNQKYRFANLFYYDALFERIHFFEQHDFFSYAQKLSFLMEYMLFNKLNIRFDDNKMNKKIRHLYLKSLINLLRYSNKKYILVRFLEFLKIVFRKEKMME